LNERRVEAQSPAKEPGSYQLTGPETIAAGMPAVISSIRHTVGQAGPKKAITLLRTLNQKDGVDCMSCAWPDPEHRSIAEFCENGAKAVADEGTLKRAYPEQFTVEELSRQSDYWLNQQGRLTQPLILRAGQSRYEPISWDEAIARIAAQLKSTPPDRNIFYTSGRTSNEAAFLYQLMARRHGTNNLPDCANLCHESSGVGLGATLGVSKGTVTLEDFYQAEVIVVVGQNPGTNHPRMLSALQRAKQNGARIVSINPLPEAGLSRFKNPQDYMHPLKAFSKSTPMADLHLPVSINGDVALFQWICRRLLEGHKQEDAFIEAYTKGYEAFRDSVQNASLDGTGLTEKQVQPLLEWLSQTRRIVFCWAMGLTQHINAVDNIKAIVNTCLLRGAIGHPGAGLCPVRGHSNVQGDRTMGITAYPKQAFLDRLGQHFKFQPPHNPGLDVVKAVQAMLDGKVDNLVCLGGNFLSACPDTELTAQALKNTKLTVQISTKLNRSHLITGEEALILPCLGRTEEDGNQFVTVEDSMSVVHRSQGKQMPASSQLRSEIAIVCDLAGQLLDTDWSEYRRNYDLIRNEIEAVVPGFSDFNRRVRQPSGFVLPILPRQGIFPTSDGKAHFTPLTPPDLRLPQGHFYMMTIRSHDQFNTTIYGNDDRYRGIHNKRRVVLVNPEDASLQKLRTGDVVDLLCEHRRADNFTVVTYPIPPGCTATYFPEANALVPLDKTAHGSNTPAYKSVIIRLEPRK
jgi:formate dehydrogenase major subunit